MRGASRAWGMLGIPLEFPSETPRILMKPDLRGEAGVRVE